MQQYINFHPFCYCRHFKWPSISQVFCYSPSLKRFCWAESNISNHYKPIRIYTFRIFTWDVDRKKDQDRPYLNHLGKNSGAPNVNFWGKYLIGRRSEIQNFWNSCCKISCSPAQDFRTSRKWYNCPFLTDFYPKKVTQNFREPLFWLKF